MNKYQEALARMWEGLQTEFKELGLAYSDKQTLQELVDRDTPKKPIWEHAYMCNKCFNQVVENNMNFCPNCGQALDWTNESEQIAKGETK